jgi:CRP/FNR family nitrogen fixation transcriptional regulator
MLKQFGPTAVDTFDPGLALTHSGPLHALLALERIGARRSFVRDDEIYAEGEPADFWFMVVSGTVRICKLMADGRRHIAEFCYAGDCFGLESAAQRLFSAEAVGEVVVIRYSHRGTERLIDDEPALARRLCEITMRDLAHAQSRMLLLGRMTAPERVASFLIEFSDRRDPQRALEVPMSRSDIADYLGLTIETVCRVLSTFKREGAIAFSNPHRIELLDRNALIEMCEAYGPAQIDN